MRQLIPTICFLFLSVFLSAQVIIKGRVLDSETGEPLAFVAVVEKGTSNGSYSDIDGYFHLSFSSQADSISFTYIGYTTKTIAFHGRQNWTIHLVRRSFVMNEVVVFPGENPAERIIRKAIANKRKNNPEGERSFSYDSYNKLVFTSDADSVYFDDSLRYAQLSEAEKKEVDFFRQQHLMIMESVSHRKFLPPDHQSEHIIATRVSGLQRPEFALLATQMQSFSFYGEGIQVLDASYFSPLANGAISKYLFILEDTTFVGADTVFTLSFRPRKGKNFEGLTGQLFINTNGYAIQHVIAEPMETADNFSIKIQQQYQYLKGVWFPEQLNTFIVFPQLKIGASAVKGVGRSYIQHIQFDEEMRPREFSPIALQMDKSAHSATDSIWNRFRNKPLDIKEQNTYHTMDSLGKAENFDRMADVLTMIASGSIPFGIVSLDLRKIMNYNGFEGFRLGGGVRTNDFLSEWFSIGGYYGYGFKDQHSKYGGDLMVYFHRQRNGYIQFLYEQDVKETAGNQLQPPVQGFLNTDYYPLFVSRMDRYEKKEIRINGRVFRNISLRLFANRQLIKPFPGILFYGPQTEHVTLFSKDFNIVETGVHLRYAPGEKLVLVGKREVRLRGRWPVFYLAFTRGIKNILSGEYDYSRYDFLTEKTFHIQNVGNFKARVTGGLISGNVPLSLLYNVRGSNGLTQRWQLLSLAAPNTFETMKVNAFQNTSFIAVHLRHEFKRLLFKRPKFAPHLSLLQNMVWGNMHHREQYNVPVFGLPKGYYESGIAFDRLIKSSATNMGLGFFYLYGPYQSRIVKNNFSIKFTVQIGNS